MKMNKIIMREKINIIESANEIINILINSGYETYAVGGCVRDSLLGKIPEDWDICTEATTSQIKKIFSRHKTIDFGSKFGTIVVMNHGKPFEITTFRLEGDYYDNRHPSSIEFTKDVEEDLLRRDFTINAMGYNDRVGLIDISDGVSDLQNRLIRTVGDADKRFSEDALRIIRALRFSAVLKFDIEKYTAEAIVRNSQGLSNISYERIRAEFDKLIVTKNAANLIKEYKEVFFQIIPELREEDGFAQKNYHHKYDVLEHSLVALDNCDKDITLRLATLLHDIAKPRTFSLDEDGVGHFFGHANLGAIISRDILTRMKYDKNTVDEVEKLIKYHDMVIDKDFVFIKRWLGKLGVVTFKKLLRLKRADNLAQADFVIEDRLKDLDEISKMVDQIQWEEQCFDLKDLEINGRDLLDIGFAQGKTIGNILNILLEAVISEAVDNKKELLLQYVDEHFHRDADMDFL